MSINRPKHTLAKLLNSVYLLLLLKISVNDISS